MGSSQTAITELITLDTKMYHDDLACCIEIDDLRTSLVPLDVSVYEKFLKLTIEYGLKYLLCKEQ
jgi:hypothetical protein